MSGTTPTTVYWIIAATTLEVMQYGTVTSDRWAGFQQSSQAVAINVQQYNQLLAGGRWLWQGGQLVAIPGSTPPLQQAQAAALATIDAQAEASRLLFFTPGTGQAMAYQAKAQQAQQFLAQYPTDTQAAAASPQDWLFMAAEIGITAPDMWGVAQVVNGLQQAWTEIAALIEHLRLGAKLAVNQATSLAQITEALAIQWPTTASVTAGPGTGMITAALEAPGVSGGAAVLAGPGTLTATGAAPTGTV